MSKGFAIAFILAAVCISACRSSLDTEGTGFVRFNVREDPSIADAVSPAVKSNLSSFVDSLPGEENFVLTVFRDDSKLWSGPLPDWPAHRRLPINAYKVSAVYETGEEGCGRPALAGEQAFVLAGFDTTEVTVTVHLTNCILKVTYSENFRNYFPTASVKVTTGAGNEFTFDDGNDEAVFIDAYRFSAACACINQTGTAMELGPFEYDNLKAGVCYDLHFDISAIGSASVTVTVNFDDSAEEVDLGIIDLN